MVGRTDGQDRRSRQRPFIADVRLDGAGRRTGMVSEDRIEAIVPGGPGGTPFGTAPGGGASRWLGCWLSGRRPALSRTGRSTRPMACCLRRRRSGGRRCPPGRRASSRNGVVSDAEMERRSWRSWRAGRRRASASLSATSLPALAAGRSACRTDDPAAAAAVYDRCYAEHVGYVSPTYMAAKRASAEERERFLVVVGLVEEGFELRPDATRDEIREVVQGADL